MEMWWGEGLRERGGRGGLRIWWVGCQFYTIMETASDKYMNNCLCFTYIFRCKLNRGNDRHVEVNDFAKLTVTRIRRTPPDSSFFVSSFLIIYKAWDIKAQQGTLYIIRGIWSEVWVLSQLYSTTKSPLMWNDFRCGISDLCSFLLKFEGFCHHILKLESLAFPLQGPQNHQKWHHLLPSQSDNSTVHCPHPPPPAGTILALLLRCREESASSFLSPLPLHVKKNWLRQQSCRGSGV